MTTTVIKSIGSAPGRDYATIQAWANACPADLVAVDQIWRGECYNDSVFTSGTFNHTSIFNQVTGPNNYIELTTGPGQSFRDHAGKATNPLRADQTKGVLLTHGQGSSNVLEFGPPYTRISNLQIVNTAGYGIYCGGNGTTNCVLENLLIDSWDSAIRARNPNIVRNVIGIVRGGTAKGIDFGFGYGSAAINTTIVRPSNLTVTGTAFSVSEAAGLKLVNCAGFGFTNFTNTTAAGCTNNASDVAITIGANNQESLTYGNQFVSTVAASVDFRLKTGSNLINTGATDTTDLPAATDITGTARTDTWDIGAWEVLPVAAAPVAPTSPIATAGNTNATVAFTAPVGSFPAISSFTVTATPGGATGTGTASPITVAGLTNGTPYTFKVKATNSVGTGLESVASNSVTPFVDTVAPAYVSGTTNANGTEITLTFDEPFATATLTTAVFSIGRTIGSVVVSGNIVKLLGITSPINGGETIAVTYTKPATNPLADISGNQLASFGPVNIANIVPVRPLLTGYVVKVYGDTDIADFKTPDQLANYIGGLNCVTLASNVMIYLDKNLDAADKYFGPNATNDSYYVTMRPMPGKGFDDLEPDSAPGAIGTLGIDVNVANAQFTQGILMEGLRIRTSGGNGILRHRGTHTGDAGGMRGCRLRHTGTGNAMLCGFGGGSFLVSDCLFEVDGNNSVDIINDQGSVRCQRNSFVRLNAAVGYSAVNHEYSGNYDTDNVFYNCGGSPYRRVSNEAKNNFTNTALTAPNSTVTYLSGPFFESTSNYRPAAGSGLLGVGSRFAISVNDNNGNNRGLLPDVGAFQRTPAIPLPLGAFTSQTLDGQSLTVQVAVSRAPDSASIVLIPANPANGAQTVGPASLVINGSTASVTVDDIPAGDYLAPSVILVNAGGTNAASGAVPFSIMGIDNLVYDTGGVGVDGGNTDPTLPAPVITIATGDLNIMAGKRATLSGSVSLQGDATGHVDLFLDPQPSGAPVSVGAANVTSGTWTKQTDIAPGFYKLRVDATANGQTTSASSGDVRVLNLVGNFTLPTA